MIEEPIYSVGPNPPFRKPGVQPIPCTYTGYRWFKIWNGHWDYIGVLGALGGEEPKLYPSAETPGELIVKEEVQ